MSVEPVGTISALDPANPPDADGIIEGAGHLRAIKGAVVNSFPNLTDPVVNTSADLNNSLLKTRGPGIQVAVIYGGDGNGSITPLTDFGKVLMSLQDQNQMVQVINAYVPTTGGVMSGGLVVPEVVLNQNGTFALQSPEGYATILFPDGFYIQHGNRGTMVFGAAGTQVAEIDAAGNLNIRGKVTENYGF